MEKARSTYFGKILAATTLAAMVSFSDTFASEYQSLYDAVHSSDNPRTYTLEETETSSRALGNMGGSSDATLTIDGGTGHWGINNTSTTANTRIFVTKTNQTLNLQNLGSYSTVTSDAIIDGINLITEVNIGESVNGFGISSDYVGFIRSAGKTNVINSVFYNNFGKYGAALQNRDDNSNYGTMSIKGSVFANNSSEQGAVHNDGSYNITEISDSIFYNNYASDGGGAIYNKAGKTIEIIKDSWFVDNYADDYTGVEHHYFYDVW